MPPQRSGCGDQTQAWITCYFAELNAANKGLLCTARHTRFSARQFKLQAWFWLNAKTRTFLVPHTDVASSHYTRSWCLSGQDKSRLSLTKRSTTWPQKPATWPHLKQAVFLSSSVQDLSLSPRPPKPDGPHSSNFPISINLQPQSVTIKKLVARKRRDKLLILHSNTNPVNNHLCNSRNEGLETSKHYKLHNLFPEDRIQYHRPTEPWRMNCATLLVAFQQTCYVGIYNPRSSSTAVHGWIIHWYRDTRKRCRTTTSSAKSTLHLLRWPVRRLTITIWLTLDTGQVTSIPVRTEMSRPGRANITQIPYFCMF